MDVLAVLRQDDSLAAMVYDICDIDILPVCRAPRNENQRLTYSIPGESFGKDGAGGDYILLEDGSIGYSGSGGECGRIADSLTEFFTFMVNCPFWMEYGNREPSAYEQGAGALCAFAKRLYVEHAEMAEEDLDINLREVRQDIAKKLQIPLCDDVEPVLRKFYSSATRTPRLIATYTGQDGAKHSGTGSLVRGV